MKPQHVEELCFIDREQRTIESQVLDFESVWGGESATFSESPCRKSEGVVPPEPFSCSATQAKVNTPLHTLMERKWSSFSTYREGVHRSRARRLGRYYGFGFEK